MLLQRCLGLCKKYQWQKDKEVKNILRVGTMRDSDIAIFVRRLYLVNYMRGLKWMSGAVVLFSMHFFVAPFLLMMKTFLIFSRKLRYIQLTFKVLIHITVSDLELINCRW